MIDVKELQRKYSLEELNAAAERYFAKVDDHTYLLSKPFASVHECPKLLFPFEGQAPLPRRRESQPGR